MNTKQLLLATLLATLFAPAMARGAGERDAASAAVFEATEAGDEGGSAADADSPHPRDVTRERFVIKHGEGMAFEHVDPSAFTGPLLMQRGRVVKNAPYSAEAVSEQQHTLGDGNQISKKTSSMTYRDSAGRTRQEQRDDKGNVRVVTIQDPVAGTTLVLRPEKKTAVRIEQGAINAERAEARLAAEQARQAADKARQAGEKARLAGERARERAEEIRREHGERVIVKRIKRSDGEGEHRIHENVRIQVARDLAEHPPMAGMERFGPTIAGAFGDLKWSGKTTTKDLGSKEMDGVKAQGKLRSYEIPAGEIGNRNPIVVSTETWYAPDLQVTLLSKHSDPRKGERTWRLAGLKREEPAASLFSIPSDYTVKDALTRTRKVEVKK